jgi:Ca2+/Na+ antiporter
MGFLARKTGLGGWIWESDANELIICSSVWGLKPAKRAVRAHLPKSGGTVNTFLTTMAQALALLDWGRWTLLFPGLVLLYLASWWASEATGGRPGRRAVGHWTVVAAVTLVAIVMRRSDLAVAAIFASSVGCLSLLVGSISIVCPNVEAPPDFRKIWPLTLPAALLVLLAGFAGALNWRHAIALLIEGLVLLAAWRELSAGSEAQATPPPRPVLSNANLVLSVCLAIVAAAAALLGIRNVSRGIPEISQTALVVALLGPVLVLPMLTRGAAGRGRQERAGEVTSVAVGVVLLNLCLLLPAVILLWYLAGTSNHSWSLDWHSLSQVSPMPFSWVTWRVDNVVLVLLSFVLVPVAMGRWRLGQAEGVTLIALYGVYVLIEAAGTMRP